MTAVVPAYNAASFVSAAVESVLAQTYEPVECVVVDDGSTDATSTVVAGFGSRVRCIRKANGGVASARNTGLADARGEFVAFLDADDTWVPHKLERQMELFRSAPSTGLVYSGIAVVDEHLRPVGTIDPAPVDVALRNTLLLEQPFATGVGSTGVLPARVLREIGGFDERLSTSADCDLVCRVAIRYPLACCPEPLAHYRSHPSQMSLNVEVFEHDMRIILRKLFFEMDLPVELASLRRRAYANMYFNLAAGYLLQGKRRKGARYLCAAAINEPRRTGSLLWRRVRFGPRPRPFATASSSAS
ncbi:MAG TPA: glycosyltransferase family 2 protein [Acidimicrobiales bacterium]|nr:glycosyltransferase family 2 protein [Acidimicrobiales bacterium]